MRFFQIAIIFLAVSGLSSCAGVTDISPQVNGLAIAGRFDQALAVLDNPKKYGMNNQLLFFLDKGLVLHLAGRYQESAEVFDAAKFCYDELYTQSVSKITGSWLWNDYALPYRGEDFERVMLNIFNALNFAALGHIDEALVEARDVDSILNAINEQYTPEQKNVYREDAFARLLMGLLYEADGNLNDALISYRLSWQAYERDYRKYYSVDAPLILKENLLAAAEKFVDSDLAQYRQVFSGVKFLPWDEKKKMGEIIVIEYAGLSPLKLPAQIPVALPGGYVSQVTFPRYQRRTDNISSAEITVSSLEGGAMFTAKSELGEDIQAIAVKNLNDRKVRVMAKAVLRPAGKYLLERGLEMSLRKDHGQGTASVMQYVGSLYNVISERPDLRSWQTLPAQIRMGRLFLKPGTYDLAVGKAKMSPVNIHAGEKKFFIVRTLQ